MYVRKYLARTIVLFLSTLAHLVLKIKTVWTHLYLHFLHMNLLYSSVSVYLHMHTYMNICTHTQMRARGIAYGFKRRVGIKALPVTNVCNGYTCSFTS